jgi:hypothetical protein
MEIAQRFFSSPVLSVQEIGQISLNELNELLGLVDFCVRKDGDYYVLVNMNADTLTQQVTDYTPAQVEYFKRLVGMIMEHNLEVSSTIALQRTGKFMSKITAEHLIDRLVSDWWISSTEGRLRLGPRTRLELELYISQEYSDLISDCSICNDAILVPVLSSY